MTTELQEKTELDKPDIDDVKHLFTPPEYDIALCGEKIGSELLPFGARPSKICSMCVEIADSNGYDW